MASVRLRSPHSRSADPKSLLQRCTLVTAFALACISTPAFGQESAYVPVEQRFTAAQLRETGLDQLDAAQLARLNMLLRDDQTAQVAAVREEARREIAAAPAENAGGRGMFDRRAEPVVSRIVGEFRGWDSGTVFALANGQRWRVVQTPEFYLPKSKTVDGPAVAVTPGLVSGWYLQVEGQSPRAKVQLVR